MEATLVTSVEATSIHFHGIGIASMEEVTMKAHGSFKTVGSYISMEVKLTSFESEYHLHESDCMCMQKF